MRKINFGELHLGDVAKNRLAQAIAKEWISEGANTKEFETLFAEKFGYKYAIATSSGTTACMAALMTLHDFGADYGDEVIVPACTFVATANAVLAAGFIPRFIDIELETLNIDPECIEDAITDDTVGIMPVHLMGKPAPMNEIQEIANNHDLAVIEDCCLPAGQKIITDNGLKKVEDINEGDSVLTHLGAFKKVINTMNRKYNGAIYEFYTYGSNEELRTTDNHPLYCVDTYDIQERRDKRWVRAEEIKVGNYLIFPRYKTVKDIESIDLTNYDGRSSNRHVSLFNSRIRESIPADLDLMNIIGWYLAEGWTCKQHVEFSLNKREKENIDSLCSSAERLGFSYEIKDRGNERPIYNICIFSKQLKQWLEDEFGRSCDAKKLPQWVLDLPEEKVKKILEAYTKGDGCKVKKRESQYSITSVSLDLLMGIKMICSKLGYYAGITQVAKRGKSEVLGRQVQVLDKYQLRYSIRRSNSIERRIYIDDDYIYYRVRKITATEQEQKQAIRVYNFEVDGDNSYCGLSWTLHNCEAHGAKYKGRYVGTIGDAGVFSFFAAHIVVAGEGGMVVTDDPKFASVVQSVKSHGRPPGSQYFDFQRYGLNLKTNDLCAAVGIEGVYNFDKTFNKRKENLYKLLIATKELEDQCYFLKEEKYEVISPHAFPIILKNDDRDALYRYLEANGIQCKTLFGSLPTQHNAFSFLGYNPGDFPIAEYVGKHGLHFGIHQYLSNDDIVYIVGTLKKYFELKKPL